MPVTLHGRGVRRREVHRHGQVHQPQRARVDARPRRRGGGAQRGGRLKPGMFAVARSSSARSRSPVVPPTALAQDDTERARLRRRSTTRCRSAWCSSARRRADVVAVLERRARPARTSSVSPGPTCATAHGWSSRHAVARRTLRRRPIFASVLILVVCVIGIAGYLQLGVDRFPNVDFPVVVVTTRARRRARGGRDRDHRQDRRGGQHHQRHRRAALGHDRGRLAGRRHVHRSRRTSTSPRRRCATTSTRSLRDLPEGHRPADRCRSSIPTRRRSSTSRSRSQGHTVRETTELADKRVRRSLESIDGVGQVQLVGGRKRQINVLLDPIKLRGAGVTVARRAARDRRAEPDDARRPRRHRARRAHAAHPRARDRPRRRSATSSCGRRRATRSASATWATSRTARRTPTRPRSSTARPRCSSRSASSRARTPSQVADAVKERVERPRASTLPAGYSIEVVRDDSGVIRTSVDAVKEHLVLGALLAALVVFLFLGNVRSTIIAAIAIPTSIIGTFATDVVGGLHAQHDHAARAGARGRHRHRRRDRRAREHLPPHRGEEREADEAPPSRRPRRSASPSWRRRCRSSRCSCPVAFMGGIAGALPALASA